MVLIRKPRGYTVNKLYFHDAGLRRFAELRTGQLFWSSDRIGSWRMKVSETQFVALLCGDLITTEDLDERVHLIDKPIVIQPGD